MIPRALHRSAPARPGLAWAGGLLGVALATALAACSSQGPNVSGYRPGGTSLQPPLGPIVDSVLVPPFAKAEGVVVNPVDLTELGTLLSEDLGARPGVRVYPRPPTTLPNTAVAFGRLTSYQTREQRGTGVYLRTIDLAAEVTVRFGPDPLVMALADATRATPNVVNGQAPTLQVRARLTYQKIYPSPQGVPALEYDSHHASQELAAQLAEILMPLHHAPPRVESAVDRGIGGDLSLPLLEKGNAQAREGFYDRALETWAVLIFDPQGSGGKQARVVSAQVTDARRYRVTPRTLERLRASGVSAEQVQRLRPLTKQSPQDLIHFRAQVRKVLGPDSGIEPQVLQLSVNQLDRILLNLGRAHQNMAQVYLRRDQLDLAAYHLARAYAFDPRPETLDQFTRLALRRDMLTTADISGAVVPPADRTGKPQPLPQKTLAAGAALLELALRIPPPRMALVVGGPFEQSVLPPAAIADMPEPFRPQGAAAAAPAALPGAGQSGAAGMESAPGPDSAAGTPTALPPIEAPVQLPATTKP